MCGGIIGSLFGAGGAPEATEVKTDPIQTAITETKTDTGDPNAKKDQKNRYGASKARKVNTPLSDSVASATNGTGSSKNFGSNGV